MLVSQAWRDIINATPQLWTTLRIRHPRHFANPDRLLQQLKKSGECPLDVILKVPLGVTELQPTLALLHNHVRRFRVLNIDVPTPDIVDIIPPSIALTVGMSSGNAAPRLEELQIAIDDMEHMPTNEEQSYFEYAFHPTPRLRRLTFSPLRTPPPSSKFLSTVTALAIISGPEEPPTPVEQMLDTIAAIPHLETLEYSGYHIFSYQSTHSLEYPRIVPLPYLEAADVTVPGCGLDILQCLAVPNLRSLRLDGWRDEDFAEPWIDGNLTDVSASLKRLPQRAPCIRRLDLHRIEYLEAETFAWLFNQTDFARLEELRIEGSAITDTAFTRSLSHGPRLRRLELRNCEHVTGSALMSYMEARQLSGDGDFRLLLSGCLGVDAECLAQLSRLVTVDDADN
jgi:hypothetical protein